MSSLCVYLLSMRREFNGVVQGFRLFSLPAKGGAVPTEPYTSRAGFYFAGWFTTSSFSGGRITFPYTVTQNITLYAKWTAAETLTEIWTPA